LVSSVRAKDRVLRIGEHDFLVLLSGLRGRGHAALAAAKLKRTLEQHVVLHGWHVQPAVAIGLAMFPSDGTEAAELCLGADKACQEARSESDGFAFWQGPVHGGGFTRADLRDALDRNQMELYFQPILDLRTGDIAGYEALARWIHPRIGP